MSSTSDAPTQTGVRAQRHVGAAPSGSTVVVIEDDASIADLVDLYLRREGHVVYLAPGGQRGLELIGAHDPDVVVLDIGLPDIDGLELCRRLRTQGSRAGIIFLTARDDEIDRVLGLELGADDYVTKPFSPRELVARVKAVLRRSDPSALGAPVATAVVRLGAIEVDSARREVRLDRTPVPFATREFDLLDHLARHRGQALSRRQLIDAVWGDDWEGDERTVDVHVRQLRRKLGDALALHTVWGVGYRLD
jgi:DNA-binding response OmpR family regulator